MAGRARRGKKGAQQTELVFRTHGGARANAGRKASPERKGFVPHRARPRLDGRTPAHVTFRAVAGAPRLRTQRALKIVHEHVARVSKRSGGRFRVNHFSVQDDHLHLIVEAEDRAHLWRGVQWLSAALARKLNRLVERIGRFWRDRYHRRDLATPREVRNTLVYLLMNVRKHARAWARPRADLGSPPLDPCSSAAWLAGWDPRAGPALVEVRAALARWGLDACPVVAPRTWLGGPAWRRLGLLRATELPRAASG